METLIYEMLTCIFWNLAVYYCLFQYRLAVRDLKLLSFSEWLTFRGLTKALAPAFSLTVIVNHPNNPGILLGGFLAIHWLTNSDN